MLTGSNSNFRFNNSFRLLSTGAWDSPCSANLNSYTSLLPIFPYMYLDAVVRLELQYSLSISFVFLISYILAFFLECHLSMSLSHSFFSSHRNAFNFTWTILSPHFSLKTDIFFYPLNFINSFHLSDVIDNISPLTIIKCFPFLMLLISLCLLTVVSQSLHF